MRSWALGTAVLGIALLSGCGGGEDDAPDVVVFETSGKITYKGQPVEGADVTFHSDPPGKSAVGRTNADGQYYLTTFKMNDGAIAGKQIVTVSKMEVPPTTPGLAPVESEEYAPPGVGESTMPTVAQKSLLPEKYATPQTTNLRAEVGPETDNEFDFDLED